MPEELKLMHGYIVTHKRLLSNRSGAAYVVALTTLLVGMITALAMLRASNAYFISEDSRSKKQQAMDLADAGIDYAYWQVQYQNKSLPFSADVTLGTGRFHVDATDDGSRDKSTMLIVSKGTCGKQSYTQKRVTMGILPYDYAMCSNRDISDGDTIYTGSTGGVRTNGRISLTNGYTSITNGAWAATTISSYGYISPVYPNSPPIAFPDIDYDNYSSIASAYYYGSANFSTFNMRNNYGVIYVNGDVNISSSIYSGVFIIVAKNNININGSLIPLNSSSFLALVTQNAININTYGGNIYALLYSHKSDNTAYIDVHDNTTFVGSIASDKIFTEDTIAITSNNNINLSTLRKLYMPGL